MTFDLIFISAFVAGWLVCGLLPWFVLSVVTRGHAGMGMLPLCLFAAVVAGLAVPLLGPDDETGLVLSFSLAVALPTILLALRRYAMAAVPRAVRAAHQPREAKQQ